MPTREIVHKGSQTITKPQDLRKGSPARNIQSDRSPKKHTDDNFDPNFVGVSAHSQHPSAIPGDKLSPFSEKMRPSTATAAMVTGKYNAGALPQYQTTTMQQEFNPFATDN